MARHKMFVDCSKAARELGFKASSVEAALERAVTWYAQNDYARDNGAAANFGQAA